MLTFLGVQDQRPGLPSARGPAPGSDSLLPSGNRSSGCQGTATVWMGLWGFQSPAHRVLATWSRSPRGQEAPLRRALGAEQQGAPRSRRAASGPGQEGGLGSSGEGASWRGGTEFYWGPLARKGLLSSRPQRSARTFWQVLPSAMGQGAASEGGARLPAPITGWVSWSLLRGRAQQCPGCWGRGREGLCRARWPLGPGSQGLSAALLEGRVSARSLLLQRGPSASGRSCADPGEQDMSLGWG